jgi:cytosine deaminase
MRACFDAVTVNAAKILHPTATGSRRADFVLQARDPSRRSVCGRRGCVSTVGGKLVAATPAATAALHLRDRRLTLRR